MSAPYPPLPNVTLNTLLLAGRAALIDPTIGPVVPAPGLGGSRPMDVRIMGKSFESNGDTNVGTQGWVPGSTGWPWMVLASYHGQHDNKKETGRVWSNYTGFLYIGLSNNVNAVTDLHGWASDWDEVLLQWFARYRRFNRPDLTPNNDAYWEYDDGEIRSFVFAGIAAYGLIARLHIFNKTLVTYGV